MRLKVEKYARKCYGNSSKKLWQPALKTAFMIIRKKQISEIFLLVNVIRLLKQFMLSRIRGNVGFLGTIRSLAEISLYL